MLTSTDPYLASKVVSLIEVSRKLHHKDLETNLKEYHEILDTLIFLHETLAELKIQMPHWKTYSDTLMTKFYLHSTSFYNILLGTEIKSNYFQSKDYNKKMIDMPTAQIILRGQLEAFLMYHHIYVNPLTEDEKELRFKAWIYSSLLDRQTFPDATAFAQQQKRKDKKQIELLKSEMLSLPAFKNLSTQQQTTLLEKGNARLFKNWRMIMKETGFNAEKFGIFYNVLSSYAHSQGLSILQLKQSKLGYNKHDPYANTILFISKELLCLMILTIKKMYKIIEIKFNGLPQALQNTIEIYAMMSKTSLDLKKN